MPKKYRLTSMEYDEVSLVDGGANDDAHVVLFKRAVPVSKDLLTPDDVHSDVPLGEEAPPKRPRKGKFNQKQARDHRGKWVRGRYSRAHTFSPPGFMVFGKSDQGGTWSISKATRAQTKQSSTLSTGPRGENGGSWNDTKHARVPAGSGDASGQFAPSKPDGKKRIMGPAHLSISSAPSMSSSGGGGGSGSKGKAQKAKAESAPISPVSPANKPLIGSADDKVSAAENNATAAHQYADSMKKYASDMAAWAKRNPSPQHDAQAQRASQAAQRAEYSAERADATVEAQKTAAAKTSATSSSSSASSTSSSSSTNGLTLAQLLAWMDSMAPLSKKNHRGTWRQD